MVLTFSVMEVMSFLTILSLLIVYSILDVRDRIVKNEIIIAGFIVGGIISFLTGHFIHYPVLHLTALILVVPLAFILFRLGSIGGADAKVLFTIALLSPGIEFGDWSLPYLEAILGLGAQLAVTLLGGYLYWRIRSKENTPPLIPMLFVGYLIVQLFALF
ncbi:MAG: prepilin peptidase [Candidatus Thorarchaeota archaeon]|jgi:Flp pilus assembly protein protease CpaA